MAWLVADMAGLPRRRSLRGSAAPPTTARQGRLQPAPIPPDPTHSIHLLRPFEPNAAAVPPPMSVPATGRRRQPLPSSSTPPPPVQPPSSSACHSAPRPSSAARYTVPPPFTFSTSPAPSRRPLSPCSQAGVSPLAGHASSLGGRQGPHRCRWPSPTLGLTPGALPVVLR